jgi:hypothetical protein
MPDLRAAMPDLRAATWDAAAQDAMRVVPATNEAGVHLHVSSPSWFVRVKSR